MRKLTPEERDLIAWVLPGERVGYKEVRDRIDGLKVVAQGRRGEGHMVLANADAVVDHDGPLPQVLAFGEIEHAEGIRHITVREPQHDQIDVEITGTGVGNERRRWTLSRWSPGEPCPRCGNDVRVIEGRTTGGYAIHLVLCPADERIWAHASRTGINYPVPITLLFSELMRITGTKDPSMAFDAARMFRHPHVFKDDELLRAFISYNQFRTKIPEDDPILAPEVREGILDRILSVFRRTS